MIRHFFISGRHRLPWPVLFENGVPKGSPGGGQPDGPSEIGRAPFGDLLTGAGEFTGLRDPHVQPGKGDQLVGGIETMDVPDTGNGRDIAAGLF